MPLRLAFMCAAALFCFLSVGADVPAAAPKTAGVTIYDPDPQHLLNRLHRAMAVRTIHGIDYGTDNAVPFLNDADELLIGETHVQLLSVLDEFLRTQTPDRPPSELSRALLQHEAWATFDHTLLLRTLNELPAQRKALRARLAKVIAFAGHEGFRHRPATFIRCPGERKDTLAYLKKLNLHTTPWALEPATIATTHLGNEIRWDPLRLDTKTPRFPKARCSH